jgi:CO/xanthine dehydrogenase FAD-binding subunit
VTMVCLECEAEMPALSWEVEEARKAGVKVLTSFGPARIRTEAGRLVGLDLIRCACVFDESGRFNPSYDPDVSESVAADQVFLAIGQRTELAAIDPGGRLRAGKNWIQADEETLKTAVPGVFAGGDVVSGPSTVIAAMAAGRKAAEAIDRHLSGERTAAAPRTATVAGSFNSEFLVKTPRAAGQVGLTAASASAGVGAASAGAGAGAAEVGAAAGAGAAEVGAGTAAGTSAEETRTCTWPEVEFEANRCFNCGCVAVNSSDLAPALIALAAQVRTSRRVIPAEDFFAVGVNGSTVLEPGEMVLEVTVPEPAADLRSAFLKFALRKSIDFPIVNCAGAIAVESGKVRSARICLNSVAGAPVRATAAERLLIGKAIDLAIAEEAADAAMQAALPLLNNRYKIQIARTLVKRVILACA